MKQILKCLLLIVFLLALCFLCYKSFPPLWLGLKTSPNRLAAGVYFFPIGVLSCSIFCLFIYTMVALGDLKDRFLKWRN